MGYGGILGLLNLFFGRQVLVSHAMIRTAAVSDTNGTVADTVATSSKAAVAVAESDKKKQ